MAKQPSAKIKKMVRKINPILKKNGVSTAALFGSVVRGQDDDTSDIDILVNYNADVTLLDVAGLQFELEQILGCKVDLVSEKFLHRRIRDRVNKEQIKIL
jgi:predicted nucleotidyltransferase